MLANASTVAAARGSLKTLSPSQVEGELRVNS